jgi:hypothetical protein
VFIGLALGEGLKWSNVFGTRSRYPRRRWTRAQLAQMDAENYEAERRARLVRQDQEWRDAAPHNSIDIGDA